MKFHSVSALCFFFLLPLVVNSQDCCQQNDCSGEYCSPAASCCSEFPNGWNGFYGQCYNATEYVCTSCPVYNINHPINGLCPINASMCCGACYSPDEYQCCPPPTYPGYQYPCLLTEICCAGVCCSTECTNGVCAQKKK